MGELALYRILSTLCASGIFFSRRPLCTTPPMPTETSHAKVRQRFVVRYLRPESGQQALAWRRKSRSNRSARGADPWHAPSRCLFAVTVLPPLPSGTILIGLHTK